jgi:hypothetical protein
MNCVLPMSLCAADAAAVCALLYVKNPAQETRAVACVWGTPPDLKHLYIAVLGLLQHAEAARVLVLSEQMEHALSAHLLQFQPRFGLLLCAVSQAAEAARVLAEEVEQVLLLG